MILGLAVGFRTVSVNRRKSCSVDIWHDHHDIDEKIYISFLLIRHACLELPDGCLDAEVYRRALGGVGRAAAQPPARLMPRSAARRDAMATWKAAAAVRRRRCCDIIARRARPVRDRNSRPGMI